MKGKLGDQEWGRRERNVSLSLTSVGSDVPYIIGISGGLGFPDKRTISIAKPAKESLLVLSTVKQLSRRSRDLFFRYSTKIIRDFFFSFRFSVKIFWSARQRA